MLRVLNNNFYKLNKMLTISAICDWAGTYPRQRNFIEGERLLKAGHIFKCGRNSDENDSRVISFTSYCLQTSKLKDHPHQIDGKISINGEILCVVCSCKAGLGEKCKHILATLLYCNRNDIEKEELSCTDKECKWKKFYQKAVDNYIPRPLLEHDCFLTETEKKFICNQEDEDDIRNIVLRNLPSSAFSKQEFGRHNPVSKKSREENHAINIPAIQAIFEEQDSELMNMIYEIQTPTLRECCLEKIKNLDGNGVQICEETAKSYTEWQRQRQYRITGTTCYNLFTYIKNKNPDWEKKCNRFFDMGNFKSQYIDYGKEKEKEALKEFIKNSGNNVVETGLIICQKNPWLAYSPDGIIMKDGKPDVLVEIKCPFKGKDKNIEEAIRLEFGKCLHFTEREIVLRKKHKYYGQIQLGMAVINVKKAFFIVYASLDRSYIVIETQRDTDFIFIMLKNLKILYFTNIVHRICEKNTSNHAKENKDNNNNIN